MGKRGKAKKKALISKHGAAAYKKMTIAEREASYCEETDAQHQKKFDENHANIQSIGSMVEGVQSSIDTNEQNREQADVASKRLLNGKCFCSSVNSFVNYFN